MKILYKDDAIEWHFTEKFDFRVTQSALRTIRKKPESHRLSAECFTNLFTGFDDDVEIRNFVYLSHAEKNSQIYEMVEKRKIEFILSKTTMKLLGAPEGVTPEAISIIDLGEIELQKSGEAESKVVKFFLINEMWGDYKQENTMIPEELLEQIIMLEEGITNDD